jgi:hypothetical protein
LRLLLLLVVSLVVAEEPDGPGSGRHRIAYRPEGATLEEETSGLRDFVGFALRELLPRIEREIPELLRRGNAEAVSPLDLFHVHFCVSEARGPNARFPDATEWNNRPYCLLYHAFERPPQLKAEWRRELGRIDNPELTQWLRILDRHRFDYRRFAQSNPRPQSKAPVLSEIHVERFARIWGAWRAERGESADYPLLEAKLVLVSGSQQPGYYQAASRVFGKRVCVTRSEHGVSRYRTLRQRHVPGHWCPLVVYFARRDDYPEIDSVLRKAEAAGLRSVVPLEGRNMPGFAPRLHDRHELLLSRLSAALRSVREEDSAGAHRLDAPCIPPLFSAVEDYLLVSWGSTYVFAIDEAG